nr:MAG TPA: tail-collar fiber protein [Caudoviricetes sp.]
MAFRGLTKKGADYLATRLANELAVEFLKVEIGDGAIISGQNPKNQTSLISYKKDVRILKKEQENNAINLTIQITNDDITQGFYLKEIGIYVNDSTSNGCLYWYCNEDNAQYIPAKTDSVIAFEIDIRMEVTNSDATIINWSGKNTWINKEYLEENYTQNGGYKGTALEIDDRVVSALGKEDGKFPLSEAVKGNVYYFPGNKKFYICKEAQNRRVSVPDGNFEELSIWENRKRLENLTRKTILLFYNGGSLVPDGTTSIAINENWYFFGLGVGTAVQSGKERMCFLFRTIFQSNNDILRFNGIEIRYNATNKTLKVINNGGNLYFLEQYSSLI